MIVLTILFSAVAAGYESVSRLLHPQSVEHLWAVAAASIIGFAGNELVAIFGNFINRALVLTGKYFEGKVPPLGILHDADKAAIESLAKFPPKIGNSIEAYRFREATANLMDLARLGNKYLADTEPWKLAKSDMERVATILNIALQVAANLAILSEPFLPFTSHKLKGMLNLAALGWSNTGTTELLGAGHQLGRAELLFDKIEDEIISLQLGRLLENKKKMELESKPVQPAKAEISFDDFAKVDMRIGMVLEAERVEKSKKLLKLKVDTGFDKRTVLSGIAEHFAPEDLIGKQVTLLVNLAPRKMMGMESQGMILMAEGKDGALKLLQAGEGVGAGALIS